MQSIVKLEPIDFKLSVTSIQRMHEDPINADVLILDEYDSMIVDNPYAIRQSCLRGIWDLNGRKVFAFSATSSPSHERLLNAFIGQPKVLKF